MIKFKERLVILREEKGFTQDKIAKDFFVVQSCISKWEKGQRQPSLDTLVALGKYFNVTTDYLLGLQD